MCAGAGRIKSSTRRSSPKPSPRPDRSSITPLPAEYAASYGIALSSARSFEGVGALGDAIAEEREGSPNWSRRSIISSSATASPPAAICRPHTFFAIWQACRDVESVVPLASAEVEFSNESESLTEATPSPPQWRARRGRAGKRETDVLLFDPAALITWLGSSALPQAVEAASQFATDKFAHMTRGRSHLLEARSCRNSPGSAGSSDVPA